MRPRCAESIARWALFVDVALQVLGQVAERAEHLVHVHNRAIDDPLACARLDPGARARSAVPAQRGGADGREITVVTVRVPEQESRADWTTVAPVHLEIDERLPGIRHQSDVAVDENR